MSTKGYKMSIESRLKMSLAAKRRLQTPEARKKIGEHNIGNKYNLGKCLSRETKLKIINTLKGKMAGEKNPRWNGGRNICRGYVLIYSPNHPYKGIKNCVSEHRLLMEKHLDRYLKPKEQVHHINGIKDDNRIENLMLFENAGEHRKHHHKLKVKEKEIFLCV